MCNLSWKITYKDKSQGLSEFSHSSCLPFVVRVPYQSHSCNSDVTFYTLNTSRHESINSAPQKTETQEGEIQEGEIEKESTGEIMLEKSESKRKNNK